MISLLSCSAFLIFPFSQAANLVKVEVETAGAVGIHLGASFSAVGVFRDDKVEIIANELGKKIIPTYIAFRDHPTRKYRVETVVGEAAQEHVIILGSLGKY